MADSILDSVKQVLQIDKDYTAFDVDVLMHINTVFSVLTQLGVGPPEGFLVEDASAAWVDFTGGDNRLNLVKSYTYARVRLLFDPPAGSYHLTNSLTEQVRELEFRINVVREGDAWVNPSPSTPDLNAVEVVVVPIQDLMENGGV